jgi:hypothetical protein
MDIPLTTFQPADQIPRRQRVPESVRAYYSVQGKDFAARELAREGFSDHAIAEALNLDVNAARKLIEL